MLGNATKAGMVRALGGDDKALVHSDAINMTFADKLQQKLQNMAQMRKQIKFYNARIGSYF